MENTAGKRLAVDPNKGKKRVALIITAVVAVIFAAYLGLCAYVGGDTLMPKSFALGVDLSGMTREQAEAAVTDRLIQMSDGKQLILVEPGTGSRVELDATGLVAQATLEGDVGVRSFLSRGAVYLGRMLSGHIFCKRQGILIVINHVITQAYIVFHRRQHVKTEALPSVMHGDHDSRMYFLHYFFRLSCVNRIVSSYGDHKEIQIF